MLVRMLTGQMRGEIGTALGDIQVVLIHHLSLIVIYWMKKKEVQRATLVILQLSSLKLDVRYDRKLCPHIFWRVKILNIVNVAGAHTFRKKSATPVVNLQHIGGWSSLLDSWRPPWPNRWNRGSMKRRENGVGCAIYKHVARWTPSRSSTWFGHWMKTADLRLRFLSFFFLECQKRLRYVAFLLNFSWNCIQFLLVSSCFALFVVVVSFAFFVQVIMRHQIISIELKWWSLRLHNDTPTFLFWLIFLSVFFILQLHQYWLLNCLDVTWIPFVKNNKKWLLM